MIIAIDFDGTIVEDKYPELGELKMCAQSVINRLHDKGHYIIIWTCREGDRLIEAINFLLHKGIKFDRVNEHYPDALVEYGYIARKVYADIYVDDRILGGFTDWLDIEDKIKELSSKKNKS